MPDTETITATTDTESTADLAPLGNGTDSTESPSTDLPAIEAVWMRPTDIMIAENVRRSFDLADYPEQVASITEFGVKDPINATREPDGTIAADDGQVRILIARQVGTPWVPVFITDAPTGLSEAERRIARTLDQITFNTRRIPLSKADYVGGVALMLDLGANVTRVAHGLQTTREQVKQHAKIGASPAATALLETGQFDLDQLAVLGHYEQLGDTEAVQRLNRCTRSGFTVEVNRILAERAAQRARLEASLPYGASGFGILTAEPDTSSAEADYLPADLLVTAEDKPVTVEHINAEPSRWVVYLHVEENGQLVEKDTGALIDSDAVDRATRTDPDAVPAAGLLHADQVEQRDRWIPFYYLPAAQLSDTGYILQPAPIVTVTDGDGESAAQANAAASARAAAEREQARQNRARTIELNIRGAAAEQRRDATLIKFAKRRTAPDQAAVFVAESLANRLDLADLQRTLHLLGVGGSRDALVKAIRAASPARAWLIVTVMVMTGHEAVLGKNLWREHTAATERYLHFLAEVTASLDFALTDVELAAAGDIDYRDIDLTA
ncbi:hypothetical protein [Nocardia sp. NPDC052566]|uniref:hypothetical protein n=1 Tax=Nocardia sp. NPDC052566 TaxID=3364330 RepID=UPI0037CB3008